MFNGEFFQYIKIWPAKIRLFNRISYTLWSSVKDDDLILGVGRNILLFGSLTSLGDFIINDIDSNINDSKAYGNLKNSITNRRDEWNHYRPDRSEWRFRFNFWFDFGRTEKLLKQENWSDWSIKACSDILNCLNLLWDAAVTVEDKRILRLLGGDDREDIGRLADILTTIDKDSLSLLDELKRESVRDSFAECRNRISHRAFNIR